MKIGDRIFITKPLVMHHKTYPIGHEFTIISSSQRGWDIKDDDGNVISETLFITDTFRCISEERDIKINKILDK